MPASVDIDSDGIPGRIEVIQPNPAERFKLNVLVSDSGRELLRIPYDHIDNTFRTHLAWRSDRGKARLLVFDGTAGQGKVRAVYFLRGHDLVAATPTREDEDLLAAMASQDDTGTFHDWLLYRAVRLPALGAICLLAVGLVYLSTRRSPNVNGPTNRPGISSC